jgi:MFS family permease
LLIAGVSQAFNSPARWALVAQVVPENALANAMTWNSSGWQIASVVGPALGGLVIERTGAAGIAYVFTASCCLVCAALVALLHPRTTVRIREPASLRSLLAGVNFVWSNPIILATITLDLFAVLFGGATALLPIYAKDILQVGPTGLGWLMAAPSLGALVMAFILAYRPPLLRPGRALLWAVAGFGLATIVFGVSHNFFLSLGMLALTGALDNISVVVRSTLVQVLAPDEMRGRVSAVNAIFISSSNQLGAFESGITAAAFGPIGSVAGGGLATLFVVAVVLWKWPQVLRLGPLHQPQVTSEEDAVAEIMEQGEELSERRV